MNRIRELRQELKWRQSDLAERLHTKRQTVARYETGERGLDVETIEKFCTIFGCTSDYLLGFSDQRRHDFTDEEAALINAFRELSPEGREYIRHSLALAQLAHGEKNGAVSGMETAT